MNAIKNDLIVFPLLFDVELSPLRCHLEGVCREIQGLYIGTGYAGMTTILNIYNFESDGCRMRNLGVIRILDLSPLRGFEMTGQLFWP